jgi:hypothetical protein
MQFLAAAAICGLIAHSIAGTTYSRGRVASNLHMKTTRMSTESQ